MLHNTLFQAMSKATEKQQVQQGMFVCGRYSNTRGSPELEREFQAINCLNNTAPRYNIAPTQSAPVIIQKSQRTIVSMQWGFIPFWAKNSGQPLINARSETLLSKPSFKNAFLHQRCLIPADGFYEWLRPGKPMPRSSVSAKQPIRFTLQPEPLFAFAGLWNLNHDPEGSTGERFVIITTQANEVVKPVHDRMPVILGPEAYDPWLDPSLTGEALMSLMKSYPAEAMRSYPVNPCVNSSAHDTARCIEPFQPLSQGMLL